MKWRNEKTRQQLLENMKELFEQKSNTIIKRT